MLWEIRFVVDIPSYPDLRLDRISRRMSDQQWFGGVIARASKMEVLMIQRLWVIGATTCLLGLLPCSRADADEKVLSGLTDSEVKKSVKELKEKWVSHRH